MRRLLFIPLLLALLVIAACDEPADPVAVGQLCLPATDHCTDDADLRRPAPGRNSLELTATNHGEDTSFRLLITTPERFELPWEPQFTDQDELILVDQTYSLANKEVLREVFGSRQLTVAQHLHITTSCLEPSCQIGIDYLFFLESVTCYDDGSCSGGFCELPFGQCAECFEDSHCSAEQTCDISRGACSPQSSQGCASLNPNAPPPWSLVLSLSLFALFILRRRPPPKLAIGLLFCLLPLFILLPPAHADTPTVSFSAGGGLRLLTAEPGRLTRPGWGISVQHQLRYGRFGASARLATHSFALQDKTIPNELRLNGFTLAIGPRAFFQIPLAIPYARSEFPFELLLGFDYLRWLVSQNRIAHITGIALSFHGAGPTLGMLWRWGGLKIMAQSNYSTIFGWPGGVFTIDLALGIEH